MLFIKIGVVLSSDEIIEFRRYGSMGVYDSDLLKGCKTALDELVCRVGWGGGQCGRTRISVGDDIKLGQH